MICIIIIFLCIAFTNGKDRNVSGAERFLNSIVSFPQRLITHISKRLSQDESFFANIKELQLENIQLKNELKSLEAKLADYEIISEQNKSYKLGENTQNNYEQFEVVLADIIADSTNNWDEIYVINKGQKDGIKPKQVVITKDGLVGYVKNTTAHTSTIITITDASTSFSGRARESRDKVIIKGNSELKEKNQIKIKDIPESVILKSGDLIETSGMGGLYPKGILVGKVISFVENTNPLENEAIAITSVDFNKLETVAIIINEVL